MIRAKHLRLVRGLKQTELARTTGMHVTSISAIENGHLKPYPGQVDKLVRALDWEGKPSELFEEVSDERLAAV